VHLDGIARTEFGQVRAQIQGVDKIGLVHGGKPC
jgi:hypothetical protein